MLKTKTVLLALILMLAVHTPVASGQDQSPEGAEFSIFSSIVEKLGQAVDLLSMRLAALSETQRAATVTAVSSTNKGGRAQTSVGTTIYGAPSRGATNIGYQPAGSVGTVTAGPVVERSSGCFQEAAVYCSSTTYTYWKYVNFDTGVSGWVKSNQIIPAASAKFAVDSSVVANTSVSVQSTPTGAVVGVQPQNSVGFVSGSPVKSGSKVLWPINFNSGVDGWVADASLRNPGVLLSLPAPVIVKAPISYVSDPKNKETLANMLGAPVSSFKANLENVIKRAEPVSQSDAVNISQLTLQNGEKIYLMVAEDKTTKDIEVSAFNDQGGLAVRTNTDNQGSFAFVAQDAAGVTTKLVGEIVYEGSIAVMTFSRVNAQGQVETVVVREPVVVDVDAYFKDYPWSELPNMMETLDPFLLNDTTGPDWNLPEWTLNGMEADATLSFGFRSTEGSDGRMYYESGVGQTVEPDTDGTDGTDSSNSSLSSLIKRDRCEYFPDETCPSYKKYKYFAEVAMDIFNAPSLNTTYWKLE